MVPQPLLASSGMQKTEAVWKPTLTEIHSPNEIHEEQLCVYTCAYIYILYMYTQYVYIYIYVYNRKYDVDINDVSTRISRHQRNTVTKQQAFGNAVNLLVA